MRPPISAVVSAWLAVAMLAIAGCAPTRQELAQEQAWRAARDAQNQRVGEAFIRGHEARGRPELPYGWPTPVPSSSGGGVPWCPSGYVGNSAADALVTVALAMLRVCPH